ncbi:MAG TPA: YegS/Rv2252/BmrU family lipid kinase [Candidatus Aquilonibacter sp.]|nr:YegS/Rv2252/BmrU family lipid kinase [Candidatus Aquilonibacter sp.]
MRKVALLYNPDSGGRRTQRQPELDSVLTLLREARIEASLLLSELPGQAAERVQQAILSGCDTVFACGGDGTIHNIVQVLAGSQVALAVLPLGTANALAHDLGLPLRPVAAARAILNAIPRRVALGHIRYMDFDGHPASSYFIIAAGIGVDAHLFYKLNPSVKAKLGMGAYYAKAWHLWLTHRMRHFEAEFATNGDAGTKRSTLTELLAVRIRNFGGVLRELAPGASLQNDELRLVLCESEKRASYLLYVLRALLGQRWNVPGVELADSKSVACRLPALETGATTASKVYVEADGELLGTLPAEITIVPDAVTILSP